MTGVQTCALPIYLIPVFAAILAMAILGERLETYHLVGFALVLAGIWLSNRQLGAHASSTTTPRKE